MDVVNILNAKNELVFAVRAIELQHDETSHSIFAKVPSTTEIMPTDSIGFQCVDGRFRIFEITKRELVEPDGVYEINGTDKAIRELMDRPIEEKRIRDLSATAAALRLIEDTDYELGAVTSTETGTFTAYYESVWSGLEKLSTAFDCAVIPYYELTRGIVTAKKIDILATVGDYRGRIFEVGQDVSEARITYDDSNIKTALYGRGRGVEIESSGSDSVSYGRRLTFADVVWSTENGDPVDKPEGQEWVGDPEALEMFGRNGEHRFGFVTFDDETDPETLLQSTWEYLQILKTPQISINAKLIDLERTHGHAFEAVRMGDTVLVRIENRGIDIKAQVVGIKRDYIRPEETELTIGNSLITSGALFKRIQGTLDNFSGKAAVWDRANAFDIQGAMDVMHNQIISTTGSWYTDPDTGAIVMVSTDGTKAMMLNGSGWMIADGKTGDAWNWRTAATGSGIVADTITTGTLNTNLINIGGTGTRMTGTEIRVVHSNLADGSVSTEINQNGLLMLHDEDVIGGLIRMNNAIISVVNALYNPAFAKFLCDIGQFEGVHEAVYGLLMKFENTEYLKVGIGEIEGDVIDTEITSTVNMNIMSDKNLGIHAKNGDIVFSFVDSGGNAHTFTASDIWRVLD